VFYDSQSPSAATTTALNEVEAVEKTNDEFAFLKCDLSRSENVDQAAKVRAPQAA
jgi:hypothetical protein